MPFLLLLFFVAEIALLIQLADALGALTVVVWTVCAVLLGINLLRLQGPATILRATQDMRSGGQPGKALLDGLFKALAAVLLIIPGVLSDVFALLLFIPVLRRWMFRTFLGRMLGHVKVFRAGPNPFDQAGSDRGNIYDHDGSAQRSANPRLKPPSREQD